MGIKINLLLGYGITDLIYNEDFIIDDSRINKSGYLMQNWLDKENYSIEGMNRLYEDKVMGDLYSPDAKIDRCIVHDWEFGLPNVLLIIPPEQYNNWKRRDNTLDYYLHESGCLNQNEGKYFPWFKELSHGIYPYGNYINIETNEHIDPYTLVEMKEFKNKIKYRSNLSCEELNQRMGFNKYQRAIPKSVVNICKYTELFNDENSIYDLKPMIYCYWS